MEHFYLGIDTTQRWGCIGLMTESGLACDIAYLSEEGGHTRILASAFESLLDSMRLPISSLAGVGVVVGPGFWTGIRVGISFAKGLVLSAKLPLIPVSSLFGLSVSYPLSDGELCVTIDARRGEIYWACFSFRDGKSEVIVQESIATPQDVALLLSEGAMVMGSGGEKVVQAGIEMGKSFKLINHIEISKGSKIAQYTRDVLKNGGFSPIEVEPLYLRRPDAVSSYRHRQG